MAQSGYLETRFPHDVYAIIPKTMIVAALVFAVSKDWLLTLAIGLPVGLLLHMIPNAFDCKVILEGQVLRFYFFRPWFFKEEHNLSVIDSVVIVPENMNNTLKDVWWRSDMLWSLGHSKLLLYKDNTVVYTLNFRTNAEDTVKLGQVIQQKFPSKSPV